MKFSKKYIAAGSAVIVSLSLCAYALNQYRSQENKDNTRVSYVDGSQSSQKTENLTPDQVSQKEGIQAEQIVDALKGTITVKDNKPKGTIFEVKIAIHTPSKKKK